MKFIYRLGYYLSGFSVGLIVLAFIFIGKKTSCNYGPSERVKNELLKKEIVLPEFVDNRHQLSDSLVRYYIRSGAVIFSESDTKRDSCNRYRFKLKTTLEVIIMDVENCKHVVRLIYFKQN